MYLLDSNPTVERIAQLIFDYAAEQGLPVVRVKVGKRPRRSPSTANEP